jgi:cell division protein FtsI/penicillin-binding protein 2
MTRSLTAILVFSFLVVAPLAATRSTTVKKQQVAPQKAVARKPVATRRAPMKAAPVVAGRAVKVSRETAPIRRPVRRRVYFSPWKEPTYADSSEGDIFAGDDPTVRRAALEALGPLNGSVVVSDPQTGRILTIVNQQVAFREAYTPCSTIKLFVALAGLSEGVIDRTTDVQISRRMSLNLTEALAHSDNSYFAQTGQKLGFDRVNYYARLFGLGERATTSPREIPGIIEPSAPDGVGMMSSFGHGVKLTPLQLAAALGAIANGGTLHYLQYPATQTDASRLVPRIKRHIEVEPFLPEIRPGMMAAVEAGTARRAGFDPEEPIFGKTGTCTDRLTPTHLGWFGSYNEVEGRKLVVVVLLTGGAPINGPVASGVAGKLYRHLSEQGYYSKPRQISSAALVDAAAAGFGQP